MTWVHYWSGPKVVSAAGDAVAMAPVHVPVRMKRWPMVVVLPVDGHVPSSAAVVVALGTWSMGALALLLLHDDHHCVHVHQMVRSSSSVQWSQKHDFHCPGSVPSAVHGAVLVDVVPLPPHWPLPGSGAVSVAGATAAPVVAWPGTRQTDWPPLEGQRIVRQRMGCCSVQWQMNCPAVVVPWVGCSSERRIQRRQSRPEERTWTRWSW